jgi:hypothetical protein
VAALTKTKAVIPIPAIQTIHSKANKFDQKNQFKETKCLKTLAS